MTKFGLFAAFAALTLAACNRPLLERSKPTVERASATIPSGRFRTIAAVAGGDSKTELRMSAQVRQQLTDSGFAVIRKAGRWESEQAAIRAICAPDAVPPVDGVLFIWYNRLELRDCTTEAAAYEIGGYGDIGIMDMANRLVRYLKRGGTSEQAQPAQPTRD